MEQERVVVSGKLADGFDGVIGESIGDVIAFRKRATNDLIVMAKNPYSFTFKWKVGLKKLQQPPIRP